MTALVEEAGELKVIATPKATMVLRDIYTPLRSVFIRPYLYAIIYTKSH